MTHKKTIEAALFISTQPLTLDQLARIAGINSLGHVKEIMEELQKDYGEHGLEIVSSADGWSMQVRPRLLPRVAHLTPYSDLGEGPKRTLALVTLKEPVKQSRIIKMQGNKAYSYIKELKKRGLIVTEKEGHTRILKLTQEFERYFGEEKSRIKEQLERHLQSSGREGEPVYEEAEQGKPESRDEFLEKKPPQKEKAKVSVIREEASREIPQENAGEEEDEEPESEEKKKEKAMKTSHNHAFQEIE